MARPRLTLTSFNEEPAGIRAPPFLNPAHHNCDNPLINTSLCNVICSCRLLKGAL